MPTRFVLVALKPEVSREAYERFIREEDYPLVPDLKTIIHYRTHRIEDSGTAGRRWDYLEQIVVTDREAYRRELEASEAFQRFRRLAGEYVAETVDFWSEVVQPPEMVAAAASPYIRWDRVPEDPRLPGISARRWAARLMLAILARFAPGARVATNAHPEETLVHVLEGRLRLRIADREEEMGPGETAIIPSYLPHSGESIGQEAALVLEVKVSPPGGVA